MKQKILGVVGFIAFLVALVIPASVTAQQSPDPRDGRFHLGVALGPQFATADSTALGIAFSGDYYLNHNLSVGPLLQFGVTDDLFQVGPTVQLKYTFDIDPRLQANLQGGIGFIYADLKRRGPDKDDTSFLIPVGPGLEYRLSDSVSLGTTVLFNFTDLDRVRHENFFVSWLGGLKVRF